MTRSISEILSTSKIIVGSETFAVISLGHQDWHMIISSGGASPRMTSPFLIFMDREEVTLIVDETDLSAMRPSLMNAKIENGFRMLTFDTQMPFDVVGFISTVSKILADAGIPILVQSSFSRDHLFVRQNDLGNALKALGPHVAELC